MPHVTVCAPGRDRSRSLGWLSVAWMETSLCTALATSKASP